MLKCKNVFCIYVLFNLKASTLSREVGSEIERIREYNQELGKSVHDEFSPCNNFLDYACHNQIDAVLTDKIILEWIYSKEEEEEEEEEETTSIESNAQKFFKSCLKTTNITKIQNSHKKWPVTEENWHPSDSILAEPIDNTDFLYYFPIIGTHVTKGNVLIFYGFTTVKNVYKEINDKNEEQEIVKIMTDLGVEEETAKILSAEIMNISKKIVTAMEKCPRNEEWYSQIKLKDLKNDFPSINWDIILQRYNYEKSNITDDSSITIIDQMCTLDYLRTISSNIRGAFNYFYWISFKPGSKLTCLHRTFKYFYPVFFKKFMEKYIDAKDVERYARIVNRVVTFVKNQIEIGNMNFTDDDVDKFARKQETIVEYLENKMDFSSFEKQLNEVSIGLHDYEGNLEKLESLTNITGKYPCEMPFKECTSLDEFEQLLISIANQHNKPLYTAFTNQFPLVLRTLAHTQERKLFDSDSTQKLKSCYENNRFSISAVLLRFFEQSEAFVGSKILKESFENYIEFINGDNNLEDNDLFDKTGLTPGQAFFVHVARDYCTKDLLDQLLFHQIIISMKDFVTEFKCPIGTSMNPIADNCFQT